MISGGNLSHHGSIHHVTIIIIINVVVVVSILRVRYDTAMVGRDYDKVLMDDGITKDDDHDHCHYTLSYVISYIGSSYYSLLDMLLLLLLNMDLILHIHLGTSFICLW